MTRRVRRPGSEISPVSLMAHVAWRVRQLPSEIIPVSLIAHSVAHPVFATPDESLGAPFPSGARATDELDTKPEGSTERARPTGPAGNHEP